MSVSRPTALVCVVYSYNVVLVMLEGLIVVAK